MQKDAERVTNVVGVKLREALSAVAALEQEGISGGHVGEISAQLPRLPGEDERRIGAEQLLGLGQRCRVGIIGKLPRLVVAPTGGMPFGVCHSARETALE